MRTRFKTEGATAAFTIEDVEPAYQDALRGLYYLPDGEGFSKLFPADTPGLDAIFRRFAQSAEALIR